MSAVPAVTRPLRMLIDTDIGSDVDDSQALLLALRCSEVDLRGVTTVYGDVGLRARIARRYVAAAGCDLPVATGTAQPLGGRPVWTTGVEGSAFELAALPRGAISWRALWREALQPDTTLLAIGPFTNLAIHLRENPAFSRGGVHVVAMGGRFSPLDDDRDVAEAEHNILCDVPAAQQVFSSDLPMTLIGVEQTRRARFDDDQVARLERLPEIGALLASEMRAWRDPRRPSGPRGNLPHDPLALATVLWPHLFTFVACEILVDDEGRTHAAPRPRGRVRLVTGFDVPAVTEAIVAALEAGTSAVA